MNLLLARPAAYTRNFLTAASDISGFKTESEANEWIAKELQDWLDRPEKSYKKPADRERRREEYCLTLDLPMPFGRDRILSP